MERSTRHTAPRTPARVALAAVLICLLPACQVFTGPDAPDRQLAEARQRWAAQGLRSYTVSQTRTCECLPPYDYTLVVEEGQVTDVLYEPAPHWVDVLGTASFLSVDQVFDLLERVLERRPAFWRVEYHPRLGYPTDIFIDIDARVVDEEIILRMADLAPLKR